MCPDPYLIPPDLTQWQWIHFAVFKYTVNWKRLTLDVTSPHFVGFAHVLLSS